MNYEKIYYAITNRAKEEAKSGIRCKSTEAYFEKHHIVPRSLNGTNSPDNIALLTAREHFLCHAILVRIYKSGTVEHNKMLFAFWRMKADPQGKSRRYINSRLYEKYRDEYSKLVSTNQSGKLNSNYGNRWYTNLNTGESKLFNICPSEEWILGRNKLRKAFNFITHEERLLVYPFEKPWVKYEDKDKYQICLEDGKIDKETISNAFVGYAPYEEPEIAITSRIPYGYSSDYAAQVTKDVIAYYYGLVDEEDVVTGTADELEAGVSNNEI